ncbi:HAD family hydrolase [Aurantibacter crassamenti]|uniref:HAD family hydrolase n=1 Tax=Aurantibacter crassamenti TaxID=1837375 RepID=UPI00193A9F64|nr:HAD family hydrolase [Aurantibacter crassamenti]MBM1106755.1 HAD family hydrolase [Aurantibacter crassamenti]
MDIKIDSKTVIVFDLDDTLYNEIDYLRSAYIEIAKKVDAQNWRELFVQMFSLYRNKENVFDFLTSSYPISKEDLILSYREHYPNINLFPGVLAFIEAIKAKDGKIAIITDGRELTQTSKIKALGLTSLIDAIVISEVIGSEKPADRNFTTIEKKFPGCQYYYIADNLKKDFISPKKLGWQTIGLIDKGLNIHNNASSFMNDIHKPANFIFDFNEATVV